MDIARDYGETKCQMCGVLCAKTAPAQKYCGECKKLAEKERKRKHRKKINPNAYKDSKSKTVVCCVGGCGGMFSSSFNGKDYCNKHYLRMYINGTTDIVGGKKNDFEIDGDVVRMYTKDNIEFIIDTEDLERVKPYKWVDNKDGYLISRLPSDGSNHVTRLHRLILNVSERGKVVDHISGDKHDNRKSNLRVTTQKNNSRNNKLAKNNKSGYTGVWMSDDGRYKASITVNGKTINLGFYETFEDAKRIRIECEHKYFGDFSPSKGALKNLAD